MSLFKPIKNGPLIRFFAVREEYALEAIDSAYDHETGDDLLHIVNESPILFFLTYIVPRSSPFITILNQAILNAHEHGFSDLVENKLDAIYYLIRMKRYKEGMKASKAQVITLGHMRHLLYFYATCVAFCCTTFFIEFIVKALK